MSHEQEIAQQEKRRRPCQKCGEMVHPENTGFHVCREAVTKKLQFNPEKQRVHVCR